MKKKLLLICFILLSINRLHSQCTYTGTPLTQVGTVTTFCIDNTNTITTGTVNSGQYVLINVVKGFNYTFSVGNVFGTNENLTILDATSNGNVSPATFASATAGVSITWTASLSGQIKLLLSSGSCSNANLVGGALTLKLNTIGNTQDDQSAFGTDQWIGHVYNWTGIAPPGGTSPTTPSATTPFTTANYVGNYSVLTENFVEGFGGNTNCFSVNSDGVARTSIYTEQYAVRYRMRSTKTGCYLINFNGDDGIRVYVDGLKVFDAWKEQAPTVYQNVLVYLTGNSNIVFDYYENGGQNECNFSIAPFVPSSNSITSTSSNSCSAVVPSLIDGSAYVYNGTTLNPSITFQWQSSSDGSNFTNISGATSEDYTPTAITTTVNVTTYYRRTVIASASNANSCLYYSNVFGITISPAIPVQPGVISGASTQCQSTTNLVYNIAAVTNATTYTWTVPTGWSITSGNGTNSIIVTSGTSGQNGNISVTAGNGCGTSSARTLTVTVVVPSVAGTVSANQTICSGSQPANITLTGNTGTIQWQISSDNITFSNITGATTTTLSGATIGILTGTRYFRALITNSPCVSATTSVVTVTVNPTSVSGTISANQSICTNTQPADITLTGNNGTIQWQSSTNNTTFTNITGATSNTLASATMGSLTATRYYKANVTSGVCSIATSSVVTVTVSTASVAGTVSANQTICSGSQPANITLTGNTGTIQWQISSDNITFSNITGATTTTLSGATIGILTGTHYFRALVTNGGCTTATSSVVTVTVNPTSVSGTVSANQSICTSTQPANITLTGNTGTIQWQSSSDNSTFTNITGATSNTLTSATMGSLTATRYYRAIVTSGVCSVATSTVVTVTVSTASVAGTVSANQTICSGSQPANITLTGNTGTIQWQISSDNITFSNITGATTTTLSGATIGILTETRYFRALVTNGGCTTATSSVVTVTVNLTSVSGTVSANQSICTSTQPANITLTGNTGTIQWQSSTDNSTFINITGATSSTLASATMGSLTTTRYYRAIVTSGVCSVATSSVVTVTVSPTSVAGTVSGNQTICSGTSPSSITLTGSVGTIQWQSSINNSTFTNITGATSATLLDTTIGNLSVVTYFRAIVTSGVCSSSTTAVVTIGLGNSTTWNGTSWSNGTPTSTSTILITGDYNLSGNITGCSMTVSNNAIVNIAPNDTVTLYGALTVNSGSTFTLNNNSSLLQNSTSANTGNIIVKRNTPSLMRLDYVMWSSPVVGQQLLSFSPMTLTNRFYTYNSSSNLYVAITAPDATNFSTGTGYLIRMPNNHPTSPTIWNGTFTGVPTNGNVNFNVTPGLYNSVGNPYPSAIDADDFIVANGITDALYFWRKTNNTNNPSYATYTIAGGVSNTGSDPLGLAPNGILQIGQGFLVKPMASTISFTNAIRVGSTTAPLLRTNLNKSRFWLNLTSTTGNFCQTMVAYLEGGTTGVDGAIDGKYFNDSQTALTSIINNEEYTIQGKGLPFVSNDTVALGFKAQLAGDYTITLDHFDGFFNSNQDIYIKDNLLNITHNLKLDSYTFVSESGVFNSRFEIVYQNTTSLSQVVFNENAVVVYHNNQDTIIKTGAIEMATVKVYDLSGRLLVTKNNINASEIKISTGTTKQVLILKITSSNNETITKKIVN